MRWIEIHLKADLHETTKSRVTVRYDLRACPVSVIAQNRCFYFFCLTEKSTTSLNLFSVAGEWWREVNKESLLKKKKLETRFIAWILMQLISKCET